MGEIELVLEQENTVEQWPYYFCTKCEHLCPVKETDTGYMECMVCGLTIVEEHGGRRVLFSTEEARIRGLPVVR